MVEDSTGAMFVSLTEQTQPCFQQHRAIYIQALNTEGLAILLQKYPQLLKNIQEKLSSDRSPGAAFFLNILVGL